MSLSIYPPLLRRSTIDEVDISQTWIDSPRCKYRLFQFEFGRWFGNVLVHRQNPHRVEDSESTKTSSILAAADTQGCEGDTHLM